MKDYKKILEGVVNIISTTEKSDIGFANICTYIGEKCPELKESEDERIRKAIINEISLLEKESVVEQRKNVYQSWLAWLEKQGEQKPADKVEPKFKVGNWYQCTKDFFGKGVTFDKNTAYYCAKEGCLQNEYGCHIAIVKGLYDNFKLWTIQDAKDGDVLDANGAPFIYKKHDKDYVYFYCGVNFEGEFIEANGIDTWNNNHKVYPVTKEQRDLLFQKMHEAGYEWDADKKELKEIEQKPAHNIVTFKDKLLELFQKFRWKCTPTNGDIIDYVDAHIQELIGTIQKPAWSEEDETVLTNLIYALANDRIGNNRDEYVEWLKSLRPQNKYAYNPYKEVVESIAEMCKHYDKASHSGLRDFYDNVKVKCKDAKEYDSLYPQNTWKPSDEQMKALKEACEEHWEPDGLDPLYTLYQDLKKLKG